MFASVEQLSLHLTGYEVANGESSQCSEIGSGKDHVIVLRSTTLSGHKNFTITFVGMKRPPTDSESITRARATPAHAIAAGLNY